MDQLVEEIVERKSCDEHEGFLEVAALAGRVLDLSEVDVAPVMARVGLQVWLALAVVSAQLGRQWAVGPQGNVEFRVAHASRVGVGERQVTDVGTFCVTQSS